MAENENNNDEYQFEEYSEIEGDAGTEEDVSSNAFQSSVPKKPDVRKNALIVIALIVVGLVLYKLYGVVFSGRQPVKNTPVPSVAVVPVKPAPDVVEATPPVPVVELPAPTVDSEITQHLSTLQLAQTSLRTDMDNLTSQLGGMSTSINQLTAKMEAMTASLNALTTKLDSQAEKIALLQPKVKPRIIKHRVYKAPIRLRYYIQAVIPGRAWLIASNGSTLTVREGSTIAGYGLVKLIDPSQGRVVTSSGITIRFNQQDS